MNLSIGELARRTGLSVKAVRFYSDRGIVPPTERSPAGYRRYGPEAVARLEFVRTLRDLGLDLASIQQVVEGTTSLPEVAAAHAEALSAQLRVLRLRRAVLIAVARRGSTSEELEIMHRLATLSTTERQLLIDTFLDSVLSPAPSLAAVRGTMTPDLPDDPSIEQVDAWVELAELTQDDDFRATVRALAERQVADNRGLQPDAIVLIRDQVAPALAAGLEPSSSAAERILFAVGPVDAEYLAAAADPRWERYFVLLAVVNGWPAPESPGPALRWLLSGLMSTP
jgi:DNA-binding transcriptional MerR regulator